MYSENEEHCSRRFGAEDRRVHQNQLAAAPVRVAAPKQKVCELGEQCGCEAKNRKEQAEKAISFDQSVQVSKGAESPMK